MGQRIAALRFGTVGPTELPAAVGTAPTNLQPQPHPAREGQDRALLPIAGPERATAAGALASKRDQRSRQVGVWAVNVCEPRVGTSEQPDPSLPAETGPRTPAKF